MSLSLTLFRSTDARVRRDAFQSDHTTLYTLVSCFSHHSISFWCYELFSTSDCPLPWTDFNNEASRLHKTRIDWSGPRVVLCISLFSLTRTLLSHINRNFTIYTNLHPQIPVPLSFSISECCIPLRLPQMPMVMHTLIHLSVPPVTLYRSQGSFQKLDVVMEKKDAMGMETDCNNYRLRMRWGSEESTTIDENDKDSKKNVYKRRRVRYAEQARGTGWRGECAPRDDEKFDRTR